MTNDTKERVNELLVGIKRGENGSIAALYELIAPTIRYIALKHLKNDVDADDLVQDFWSEIPKYAENFHVFNNGFAYICKIMTRQAINRYKKLHRRQEVEVGYVDYSEIECPNDDEEKVALRNDVSAAMLKLTETQRIIVQETLFEGMTVRQVAKTVGKSKTQVARLKTSAMEILKRELSADGWDKEND